MFLVKNISKKISLFQNISKKNNFMAHIRNNISLLCLHKVTKLMDFISKNQGYIPLKAVPYIFFLAVVLSITTSTNTFV